MLMSEVHVYQHVHGNNAGCLQVQGERHHPKAHAVA